MKKILFVLAIVSALFFCCTFTYAQENYSGECGDNLTWYLDSESGVLTISGDGDMDSMGFDYSKAWQPVRVLIRKLVIQENVTSIGMYAFSDCSNLKSVEIHESVTTIGAYSFMYCSGLESITFPDNLTKIGNNAFYECTGIKEIVIPDNVETVGSSAFYNCNSLEKITLGKNLFDLGANAFYKCTRLTELVWNSKATAHFGSNNWVFHSAGQDGPGINIVFGSRVERIPSYAFYPADDSSSMPNISSVTFGEKLTSVSNYSFAGCNTLKTITLPDSVTYIGPYAFAACQNLEKINIPLSTTTIKEGAFGGCVSLKELNWDAKSVNDFAYDLEVFYDLGDNVKGTKVVFGDTVEKIPAYAFYSLASSYPNNVYSITIGENVKSIGKYAFYNCDVLTEINWNAVNVSDIGYDNYVFYNAGKNKNGIVVTFNDKVEHIPACLFSPKSGLFPPKIKKIIIGENVTTVGSYAFYRCLDITEIIWNSANCSNLTVNDMIFSRAGHNGTGINVVFGNSVKTIPAYLFVAENVSDTPKIKNITMGENVTAVKKYAFSGNFDSLDIHITSLEAWCNIAFESATSNPMVHTSTVYLNDEILTDLVLPDSLTKIQSYAFYNCTSLKNITMGEGVRSIGDSTFYGCSNLAKLYYCGLKSDWESINVNSNGNGYIKALKPVYITKDGTYTVNDAKIAKNKCTFSIKIDLLPTQQAEIVIALYDEDDKLLGIKSQKADVLNESIEFIDVSVDFTKTPYKYKIFVWEDSEIMLPIKYNYMNIL